MPTLRIFEVTEAPKKHRVEESSEIYLNLWKVDKKVANNDPIR